MLKKILIGIVALIAIVLIYAATKPDTFAVERSIVIKVPPEAAFSLVNDFHKWPLWSPWEKLDPNMQRSYSGAESGKGAVYAWQGNSDVGKGQMEITESVPSSKILIDLDFIEPMEAGNTTEFTFSPEADGTKIVWSMRGPSPYVSKVMQVFVSMDKLVGKDFDSGLQALKTQAEQAAATPNPVAQPTTP